MTPSPMNEFPGYNIKPFDGEARPLEIWEIWSTPSLPLQPGLLRPGVAVPDKVQSMSQI